VVDGLFDGEVDDAFGELADGVGFADLGYHP
jgi:hypothetical protein